MFIRKCAHTHTAHSTHEEKRKDRKKVLIAEIDPNSLWNKYSFYHSNSMTCLVGNENEKKGTSSPLCDIRYSIRGQTISTNEK